MMNKFVFCADGYEGSIPSDCFTWKINKELEVELICKLSGANKDVNIYDSRNRYDFNCSYDKTCQAHSNERNETTFTVTVADDYEGQWFCKHGKNRLSANISISKGYLPSTQLTLSGTRHEDKSYTLSCSTCWEIDGLSVEFLVNDKTNDSVRFDDKKCYHKNRECVQSRCSCSPNSFNWTFKANDRSNIHNFSCRIHFTDSERNCMKKQTITLMVDRQDDKTVNDFALSKGCTEIYIVSKNNTNSSGTQVPDEQNKYTHPDQTCNDYIVALVVLGVLSVVSSVFAFVFACLYRHSTPKQYGGQEQGTSEENRTLTGNDSTSAQTEETRM